MTVDVAPRESAAAREVDGEMAFDVEVDMVVVGGGASGLPAALFSRWLDNDAPAPLRLHRCRPPGPLRGQAADDHQPGQVAERLVRRRHGGQPDEHPRRQARRDPGQRETVRDYQLHPGDRINLRLQNGRTKRLTTVPFRYEGVAKEFPTTPKDSFFVANQSYITARTGSDAVGSFLMQTDGTSPAIVSRRISNILGGGLLIGAAIAAVLSTTLVDVLTGVLDPPPDS